MSKTKAFAVCLVAVLATFMLTGGAAAATSVLYDQDVTLPEEDADPLEISISWDDAAVDEEEPAEADVSFYNASEYADDEDNATLVYSDVIEAAENETETEFNASEIEDLDADTEYRLIVEGDANVIDDVSISGVVEDPFGGMMDGTPGFGLGAAVAVLAVVAAALIAVAAREEVI